MTPPSSRWLTSGVAWGAVASGAVAVWVLVGLEGRSYYATPLAVRAYASTHPLLRPSGPVGHTLGVVGTLMILVPFLYMARKRWRRLQGMGALPTWLEVHLFCGIVGPALITLHTSFKFNGLVAAAYWSMVVVVLSGFAGRHLYVRIPRALRGHELTRAELDGQVEALKDELVHTGAGADALHKVDTFEHLVVPEHERLSVVDLLFGDVTVGRRLRVLDADLAGARVPESQRIEIVRLAAARALLLRRVAYLRRTRRLFELWHVFHLPLVYLLLTIAAVHIGVALYLGYVPFRW
jgi:hypothetical protein